MREHANLWGMIRPLLCGSAWGPDADWHGNLTI